MRPERERITAGEWCGLVLALAVCIVEVLFGWLGVALVLFALAVGVGGR
jgi:purine-cytosine permease-like protein